MKLQCPNCTSMSWKALEQVSAATYCEIDATEEGIEVTMDGATEFVRDMATSVTIAYMCGNDECGFTIAPDRLDSLREPPKVQQNFAPDPADIADAELHTWAPENGLAVGGLIPKDTVFQFDQEHGLEMHFIKKSSGPATDDEPFVVESDTEGHKAAAAENLENAQRMREARESNRCFDTPVESYLDRLKRAFS